MRPRKLVRVYDIHREIKDHGYFEKGFVIEQYFINFAFLVVCSNEISKLELALTLDVNVNIGTHFNGLSC
jgi:hypothetical protein